MGRQNIVRVGGLGQIPSLQHLSIDIDMYSGIRTVWPPARFWLADVNTKSTEGIRVQMSYNLDSAFYTTSLLTCLNTITLSGRRLRIVTLVIATTRCLHFLACSSFTYQSDRALTLKNSGKTRTFKPRKDVPEGTKQYQLRKYAEATLV